MTLRVRLGLSFALVAMTTALVMVLATPVVIRYGFEPVRPPAAPDGAAASAAAPASQSAAPTEGGPTPTEDLAPPATPAAPPPGTREPGVEEPTSSTQPRGSPRPTARPTPAPSPSPTGRATQSGRPSARPSEPGNGGGAGSQPPAAAPGSTTSPPGTAGADGGADNGVALAVAVVTDSGPPSDRMPGADPGPSSSPTPSSTGDPAQLAWIEVERRTSAILVVVAVLSGIVSVVIGLLLAEALIRPLHKLGAAASAVAAGDLTRRSGVGGRRDEIGELGRSFDTMAAALERSDSSRRRFLQDAAHELGTPVTAIHTTASAILDGLYEPEPRHIATIRDEARLLARIVDDLRTIALAEVRQLPMQDLPVEVTGLAAATADALRAAAASAGCTIALERAGPAWVRGDPDRLRQVVSALVDNAIRHSPSPGLVTIRTGVAGAWVTIDVEDRGPGLGDAADQVFDRFFRADAAPDRTAGHAGLGLAIVRALVEAHGGRVSASNRSGGGAAFRLELPARLPDGAEGPVL